MSNQIVNFLVKLDRRKGQFNLWTWPPGGGPSPQKAEKHLSEVFILGYQYEGFQGKDGEYVELHLHEKEILLWNDPYGSYPVYVYEDKELVILSPSIQDIQNNLPSPLSVNSELVYPYFAFGYVPVSDQTLYKNIRLLRPDSRIRVDSGLTIETQPYRLLKDRDDAANGELLAEYLCEAIERKMVPLSKGESVFCLTSGNDSLLGLLGIQANGRQTDTVTWGQQESSDIIHARSRHQVLSPETNHLEYFIDGIKPGPKELEEYAGIVGGISTVSSVFLLLFTKQMVAEGKTRHLYCDHYEATRRLLHSLDEIEHKYTTPPAVVGQFFRNREAYQRGLTSILNLIPASYGNDPLMEYYFYDRYVKGPFYKNLVIARLGATKITLPMDFGFLNLNHAYVRKANGPTYALLLQTLLRKNNRTEQPGINEQKSSQKQLPFIPGELIASNKEYFLSILDAPYSQDLKEFWKMGEIRKALLGEEHTQGQEWFLLRLMSLLIFKNKNHISLG